MATAPSRPSKHGSATGGIVAALAYSVISIAIMLFNKAVMSKFRFHHSKFLTLFQSALSAGLLVFLKRSGWLPIENLKWDKIKKVAPLSIIFISYVVISLAALSGVNLPMFSALRRTTIVFVMVVEYWLQKKIPSQGVRLAAGIMVAGAILASLRDFTFDLKSYVLLFITNLVSSLYTVNISKIRMETGLSSFSLLYYNCVISIPFLLALNLITNEFWQVAHYPQLGNPIFLMIFMSSLFLAFMLNITTYLSTTLNSPVTQCFIGEAKNAVAFIISFFVFDDYIYDHWNMLGLVISLFGSAVYAYVTFQAKQRSTHVESPTPPVTPRVVKSPELV